MLRRLITCAGLLLAVSLWGQEPPHPAPEPATAPKLLQAETPRSCPFCDLHGKDFSGRDLTDLNLAGANLEGANLSKAILKGTMLAGANLRRAILDGAHMGRSAKGRTDLSEANVTGAMFKGTEFGDADLQYAVGFAPGIEPRAAPLSHTVWDPQHQASGMVAAQQTIPAITGFSCGQADLRPLASAIYVTPGGTDSDSCGATYQQACKTISKAVARCAASGCGVLVGFGEYKLDATVNMRASVNVYGGCVPTAQGNPDFQSLVTAPSGGRPAFQAQSIRGSGVVLQGFKVTGSPATSPGEASVAVLSNVSFLHLYNSRILAGNGAPGNPGGKGGNGTDGAKGDGATAGGSSCGSAGGNGSVKMTVTTTGGWFEDTKCFPACSANSCWGYIGYSGSTSKNAKGGQWGNGNCATCAKSRGNNGNGGESGDNAGCGGSGTQSSNDAGGFNAEKWQASSGGNGSGGGNGGGGGGGGSGGYRGGYCPVGSDSTDPGNQGGGGGAGGCGGAAGGGGQQGGASFGVAAFASVLTLKSTVIVGGIGGAGGQGGDGGKGGNSGAGAGGATNEAGGYGGGGGTGGAGGAGGGGAGGNGGPAIGVALVRNSQVLPTSASYYTGTSGAVGAGGAGGTAVKTGACTASGGGAGKNGAAADTRVY